MKKIMIVFGTRPEAIKLCPLALELEKYKDKFKKIICVTAQHREMLDQVLNIFDIKPDYDLNVMEKNQSLLTVTSNILVKIGAILEKEKPDIVLVQGDTTTTFVTSLAAYYYKIKIGHVEAGLRTFDKYSPYPEEINRKLTGVIADLHFAPTNVNRQNLLSEGVSEKSIHVTGNTVVDALYYIRDLIKKRNFNYFTDMGINNQKKIILVTGHRRENFGPDFEQICYALREIALLNSDINIIYPVHLNPNVRQPVNKILSQIKNVLLIEPLEYMTFVYLMEKSFFIISDSGGIQEEAPALGKPVLVTRKTTERPEAIQTGTVKLVGTNREDIIKGAQALLHDEKSYQKMAVAKNPYGDGHACERIMKILENYFYQQI
jgi:UDP-N-acetylglucosamine 2-epimerase (non-hydrolysing)